MAANDAPPAAWIRPSARSVTLTGSGSTRRSPVEPRLDDVQRHAAGAVPGPVAHRLPEGDERRVRTQVPAGQVLRRRVAVVAAVGRAPGRVERQAEHAPGAPGVGGVEQQIAQAAVADAHLDQGVEAALGVGLDGLAGPPAGVDRAAEPRIGAPDGGDERGAPEGAVPEGERVARVVLGGRAAADVGVALGVERREVALVPGRVPVLGTEADACCRCAAGGRRGRPARRGAPRPARAAPRRRSAAGSRGACDRASRGSGHGAGTSAVSGAATGAVTPATKSAVAAKRHVAPASSEIRTMRWWNRRNVRVAGGSRREK